MMDYMDWWDGPETLPTRWPTYAEFATFDDLSGDDHWILMEMGIVWECRVIVSEEEYQASREFRAYVSS